MFDIRINDVIVASNLNPTELASEIRSKVTPMYIIIFLWKSPCFIVVDTYLISKIIIIFFENFSVIFRTRQNWGVTRERRRGVMKMNMTS